MKTKLKENPLTIVIPLLLPRVSITVYWDFRWVFKEVKKKYDMLQKQFLNCSLIALENFRKNPSKLVYWSTLLSKFLEAVTFQSTLD